MKVQLLNETFDLTPSMEHVNDLFEKINDYTNNQHLILSSMIIDGYEVYDQFEEIIQENLFDIKEIYIQLLTRNQYIDELLLTAKDYLDRVLPEMDLLSNEFYQNTSENSWTKLNQLLEGLQWIIQVLQSIKKISKDEQKYNLIWDYIYDMTSLENALSEIIDALNNKDLLLIGDLLKYELTPEIVQMQQLVSNTLDEKRMQDV